MCVVHFHRRTCRNTSIITHTNGAEAKSCRVQALRVVELEAQVDLDGLDVRVVRQRVLAELAPDAALAVPTEWSYVVDEYMHREQ